MTQALRMHRSAALAQGGGVSGKGFEVAIRDVGFIEGRHRAQAGADLRADHRLRQRFVINSRSGARVAVGVALVTMLREDLPAELLLIRELDPSASNATPLGMFKPVATISMR